eukprot:gb/GECG01014770.1/.p1 GENE.gb/GECG01014770.1/~~gb/GECG01014770.1/.p1  ORF type:complete len:279 (+),score=25.30 gb/GECG01014770.1/:1-837(+)
MFESNGCPDDWVSQMFQEMPRGRMVNQQFSGKREKAFSLQKHAEILPPVSLHCCPYIPGDNRSCLKDGIPRNLGRTVRPLQPSMTFHLCNPQNLRKRIRSESSQDTPFAEDQASEWHQDLSPTMMPRTRMSKARMEAEKLSHCFSFCAPPASYVQSQKQTQTTLQHELYQRSVLKEWMMQHWAFPYPGPGALEKLVAETRLTTTQLENWFRNERRRHWRPYMAEYYPDALEFAEEIRGTRQDGGIPSLPRTSLDLYVEAASIASTRWKQYPEWSQANL